MKRNIPFLLLAGWLCGGAAVGAESTSLEAQLESLKVPASQAPAVVSNERLYAVQSRNTPLQYRTEVTVGGAKNFTSNSFLVSNQFQASARFYLSDRWHVAVSGSYVFNSLTDAANRFVETEKLLPDTAYAKYRLDALAGFNLFFGKLRLTMDDVLYFDQYVALGPGMVGLNTGTQVAAVADIGFVFWMSRAASLRLGFKDYYFHEVRLASEGFVHHLLGHMDLGLLL